METRLRATLPDQELLKLYEQMVLSREFEESCAEQYTKGHITGFLHLYSGQEAVAAIRKLELARGIVTAADEVKILMVTAMTDGRNIMASFRTGCEGYITKPFTKESLGKALAPFLEQIGTP